MRLEDRVDVVGHDHPRVELVEPANRLAVQESVPDHTGDSRILQPCGTGSRTVEPLMLQQEAGPATSIRRRNLHLSREGTGQAPCHEDGGILRNPVGEMSPGEGHCGLTGGDRPRKSMVCPTRKSSATWRPGFSKVFSHKRQQ